MLRLIPDASCVSAKWTKEYFKMYSAQVHGKRFRYHSYYSDVTSYNLFSYFYKE